MKRAAGADLPIARSVIFGRRKRALLRVFGLTLSHGVARRLQTLLANKCAARIV